jgi:hypothetical protein
VGLTSFQNWIDELRDTITGKVECLPGWEHLMPVREFHVGQADLDLNV